MSTASRSGSRRFNLDDLDSRMDSGTSTPKPEMPKSTPSKPKIPQTRQKSLAQKKRKVEDPAVPEGFEGLNSVEMMNKIQSYLTYAFQKFVGDFEKVQEELVKANGKVDEILKLSSHKALLAEPQIKDLQKKMKEAEEKAKEEKQRLLDEAMDSATIAILESRLKMVEEAKLEGYEHVSWNVEKWTRILNTLKKKTEGTGTSGSHIEDAGETVKVADETEDAGKEKAEKDEKVEKKVAEKGDEGNDAKA